jgi:MFS family permease
MSRDVALLLGARVAMSATRASTSIIVPLYLAELGYSGVDLGVLFLVVALSAAVQSVVIGVLADRFGRKLFVVAVPLVTAASAVAFVATTATALIFVTAALGSFGRGMGAGGGSIGPYQSAEQALVSSLVPAERRTSVFGALASASAAGGLAGSLLALLPQAGLGLGLTTAGADRFALLMVAAFALLAGLLAIPVHQPPRAPVPRRRLFAIPTRSRGLLYRLWATNVVNGIGVGLFGPFLTYWFYVRFGVGTTELGLMFAAINAVTIGTNLAAGRIARTGGLVRSVVWLRLAQGLLLVPMALAPTLPLAGAVYLVRIIVQRLGMSMRQSFVMGAADPEERAAVASMGQIPGQAAGALVPPVTGYLMDEVSLAVPFVVAAGFQVAYAALFHLFFARHALPEERERVLGGPGGGPGGAPGIGRGGPGGGPGTGPGAG